MTSDSKRPTLSTLMEAVDKGQDTQEIMDELLELAEDFANHVALRARGITVATRERRKLRLDLERVILEYVTSTRVSRPLNEDIRAPARAATIATQRALEVVEESDG